ncbi:MAG: hypothetical protein ACREFY_03940 [Acetobacteraceae bacterium]
MRAIRLALFLTMTAILVIGGAAAAQAWVPVPSSICGHSSAAVHRFPPEAVQDKHPPGAWVWGTWVVTGHFNTPGGEALSSQQIKALVGTKVVYAPHEVRFGKQVMPSPTYSVQVYSDDRFTTDFHIYCRDLGICGEPIIVVDMTTTGSPYSDFPAASAIVIDSDHLAATVGNVFLKLQRVPLSHLPG